MRLFYRAKRATGAEPVYERVGPVTFCCAEMCRWWGVLVGFGARDAAASTSRDVSLFTDRPQAGGASVCVLTAVQFCPWCGEVVEPVRAK